MRRVDLKKFSDSLHYEDGIWFSESAGPFCYPKERLDVLFQIEEKSFWFIHRNSCIIEALKPYPPGGVLFELGGGNGYVSKCIQDHGYDVVLLEPSIEGVRNARMRGVVNAVCSTIEDARFHNNSVPAIAIFDVLEHIPDDERFLAAIKEMIVRDGRLYITTPAYGFLWSEEDVTAGHFRRYTPARLSTLLKSAGFRPEYASYFFSPLVVPIFIFRTVPYALGAGGRVSGERAKRELLLGRGIIRSVLDRFLSRELAKIKNGRTIACGASCLIVAKAA